jgi:hypothetical protein
MRQADRPPLDWLGASGRPELCPVHVPWSPMAGATNLPLQLRLLSWLPSPSAAPPRSVAASGNQPIIVMQTAQHRGRTHERPGGCDRVWTHDRSWNGLPNPLMGPRGIEIHAIHPYSRTSTLINISTPCMLQLGVFPPGTCRAASAKCNCRGVWRARRQRYRRPGPPCPTSDRRSATSAPVCDRVSVSATVAGLRARVGGGDWCSQAEE